MNKVIRFLSAISMLIAAKLLPFNYIVGSTCASFSWSSIVAPVMGAQYGFVWILGFLLSKKAFTASSFLVFCLHRLPLFVSARLFVKKDWLLSSFVPLACMVLFIVHPVGMAAWNYSLYWLVPVGLSLFAQDNQAVRSVQASFVAHAVGSVVWLYSGSIPSEVWLSIIPLVAYERLLIAGSMLLVHAVVCYLGNLASICYRKFLQYRVAL